MTRERATEASVKEDPEASDGSPVRAAHDARTALERTQVSVSEVRPADEAPRAKRLGRRGPPSERLGRRGPERAVRAIVHERGGRPLSLVTVWMVRRDEDFPRFITAYPGTPG
jgi:hypothetical protein